MDLPGIARLQTLMDELEGTTSRILAFGDFRYVAGNPEAIRGLSQVHMHASEALRVAGDEGQARTARLIGGGHWEGSASRAYGHYWSQVQNGTTDLASKHVQVANSLNDIAEEASRLNSQVSAQVEAANSWLESAGGALLYVDLSKIDQLLEQGDALSYEWQRIFNSLEHHASWSKAQLAVDLSLSIVAPWNNSPKVHHLGPDGYQLVEDLGPASSLSPRFRTPQQIMTYFKQHPQQVFPFGLRGAAPINRGEHIDLATPTPLNHSPVRVSDVTTSSFTFTTLPGHFDPPGSTITFKVYESGGNMYLQQTGHWKFTNPEQRPISYASVAGAYVTWDQMRGNLRQVIAG